MPVQTPVETIAQHTPTRGEKLVLVLEDEADVRQTLCEQLHLLGYLTLEAANGEQAMHMLAASSEIDIFISDLMLPGGLSGVDVINHALAHYPQLNILLISGGIYVRRIIRRCQMWRYCVSPSLGENWRRRCGIRVIEIPPLPAQIRFDYRGASFLMRLVLCNAPRHSYFSLC